VSEPATESQPPVFANFQYEIYGQGLAGEPPGLPIAAADLEQRAREVLAPGPFGYVAGGAGSERTMRSNLDAFGRWEIVPRMLRDVSVRDLSTEVLGTHMAPRCCSRRSACSRLFTNRVSWRSRVQPQLSASPSF